jgi:hypothetical protein
MNQSQAKEWLPLIQALAEGKTAQRVTADLDNSTANWLDIKNLQLDFDTLDRINPCFYRIKPEPKKQWCRMYLVKGAIGNSGECFYSAIAKNGHIRELDDVEKSPIFVRWLTDRIEYELPE